MKTINNLKNYNVMNKETVKNLNRLAENLSCSGFVFLDIERVVDLKEEELMSLNHFNKKYKPEREGYKLITEEGLFITFTRHKGSLAYGFTYGYYDFPFLDKDGKEIAKATIIFNQDKNEIICKMENYPLKNIEDKLNSSSKSVNKVERKDFFRSYDFYRQVVEELKHISTDYGITYITKKTYEDLINNIPSFANRYSEEQKEMINNILTNDVIDEIKYIDNTYLFLLFLYFDFSDVFKTNEDIKKVKMLFRYLYYKNKETDFIVFDRNINEVIEGLGLKSDNTLDWLSIIYGNLGVKEDINLLNKLFEAMNKIVGEKEADRFKTGLLTKKEMVIGTARIFNLERLNRYLLAIEERLIDEDKERSAEVLMSLVLNNKEKTTSYQDALIRSYEELDKFLEGLNKKIQVEEMLDHFNSDKYHTNLFKEDLYKLFNEDKALTILDVLDKDATLSLKLLLNEDSDLTDKDRKEVGKILNKGE